MIKKHLKSFMYVVLITMLLLTFLLTKHNVNAIQTAAEAEDHYNNSNNETWIDWTANAPVSINFTLNNVTTKATVTKPGNPVSPTSYMTNANQFGVVLNMNGKNYTYTFADGSSESSGVFFAIQNNGSASPYILRPNSPITNNGSVINPNEVRTDYKFYYSNTKVKEETIVELTTGEKLAFTQIMEFRNDGVFHESYFKNIGTKPIDDFRILAKTDTFLINDTVPVYYGERQHVYYIKQTPNGQKLRISGLNGVEGSVAAAHQRIWENHFINTYRNYNNTQMSFVGNPGALALSGQDSEIVYSQKPATLEVGEIRELTFAINYLEKANVIINYVDENGSSIAHTDFLQGTVGDPYQTTRKNITGYSLKTNQLPNNEVGQFQTYEQEVRYVYTKTQYHVTYDDNANTSADDYVFNQTYYYGNTHTIINNNIYHHPDYQFVAWNTKANGTGSEYLPGQKITINSNITLYAMWKKDTNNKNVITSNGNTNLPKTGNYYMSIVSLIGITSLLAYAIYNKNS